MRSGGISLKAPKPKLFRGGGGGGGGGRVSIPGLWTIIFQQDNDDPHPTPEPLSPLCKHLAKHHLHVLGHLLGTVCLRHSATPILPPVLKPPVQ